MHVQLVTYRMEDIGETEFIEANQEFAQMMAAVPGLLAKVWLKAPDQALFGGLYIWRDRAAYEGFLTSELWAEVLEDGSMLDVESRDFAVMDGLTRTTQPGLKLV